MKNRTEFYLKLMINTTACKIDELFDEFCVKKNKKVCEFLGLHTFYLHIEK